jgi:carbonic anhydrase
MKFAPRFDLGIRRLVPDWRALLRPAHLREDAIAGLTVASIAVPLSLAIALASGVPPALGLVTAVVSAVVVALFGGTPLAVSGPAAAMAVLIAEAVQAHGIGGLVIIGLGAGILQLATGVLGLGRFVRLVPVPVVEGFTAGIGAIILIGQLPRLLGLPPPPESHVVAVITHLGEMLPQARPASALIALGTIALVFGLPRLHPRLPAVLLAVAVPTAAVAALGIDAATIGAIPREFPLPRLPSLPAGAAWGSLLGTAVVVYALASLESLLSSSAVDKLARGERHDPDQEMIGQGLGNLASALVGGIPVTGVIARSALNVQAGARTRRAAIFHSVAILAVVFGLAPLMARIPIATLAGVLVAVALRMLDPRKFLAMARAARGDAGVAMLTFALIVSTDLVEGVQWGIVAALVLAAVRLGQSHLRLHDHDRSTARVELSGPLTFLASLQIEALRERIASVRPGRPVVLDASGATALDASGVEMLADLVRALQQRTPSVALHGLRPDLLRHALAADPTGVLAGVLAPTEQDVACRLAGGGDLPARQRLMMGVDRYRRDHLPRYAELYGRLAEKQAPHTLLITCADSRIQPALLTCTDPGEIFTVRNVGNMVPPYVAASPPPAGAALEYAVGVLGVRVIIVCAHSCCGAIRALLSPGSVPPALASLQAWLVANEAYQMVSGLPRDLAPDDTARLNALLQLEHVQSYPVVRAPLAAGTLRVFAWFFDVATGEIEEWSPGEQRWGKLDDARMAAAIVTVGAPDAPGHGANGHATAGRPA